MLQTERRTIQFWDRESETPVQVPAEALVLDGFCEWAHSGDFPVKGTISFLAGEVLIDMSPEEITTHTQVKRAVYRGWERCLDIDEIGDFLPDGPLLVNEAAQLATEPDGLLCLWATLNAGRVVYREVVEGSDRFVEVRGTPDAVLEVVSRSSVRKDTILLRDLYHRARIPEYWLIDARPDAIDFQILTWAESGYVASQVDEKGFSESRIFQRCFRLTRRRNPAGGWSYSLEFRQT